MSPRRGRGTTVVSATRCKEMPAPVGRAHRDLEPYEGSKYGEEARSPLTRRNPCTEKLPVVLSGSKSHIQCIHSRIQSHTVGSSNEDKNHQLLYYWHGGGFVQAEDHGGMSIATRHPCHVAMSMSYEQAPLAPQMWFATHGTHLRRLVNKQTAFTSLHW